MPVVVSATDAAGIQAISYRLTGAQTGEATGDLEPLAFTLTEPGVTTITVTAEDVNGNQATREYGVGLDLADPTVEVGGTVLDGGVIRQGARRTLTFTCADAGTAVASCTAGALASGALVPTDTLGAHRIDVTAVDQVGRSRIRSVDYTVEKPLLRVDEPPVIEGDPPSVRVGKTLRATAGRWTPTPDRVTYTWLSVGKIIGTGPTYTPTAADVGRRIYLTSTAYRDGYADTPTPGSTPSVLVESGRFEVTGAPQVTGTAQVGGTLEITQPDTIVPTPGTYANLWTIDGETHETDAPALPLTEAHAGSTISCVQVYSRAGYADATVPCVFPGGAGSVTVAATPGPDGPGDPGNPGADDGAAWTVLAPAAIKGKARVGRRLRAVLPQLTVPAQAWTYQWFRNGKPVKGATKASYKLRKADRGRRITVRVTASAPHLPDLVSVSPVKRIRR
ncbi:hypothetical protein [Nocardioides humi]|uniref:hypothetical protein n=1 Tax=Nocardioides humi TaxID=449461 RepID=UPI00112942FB|nr:hypothetical protein [Nocardioides humi]